ncbi:MAG: class II fructose-bisphosphate aldolase, partial [Clostridia bacterium]|nr:class II fructose-bisphosphate aldolase [Clostridia bacterium]
SSVPQQYVQEINSIGGNLPDAVGLPEEQLRKAASMAVCKINIDSDIRLALTAGIRRVMHDQPGVFDPRTYLSVARTEVKNIVSHKIKNVLGSDNTL